MRLQKLVLAALTAGPGSKGLGIQGSGSTAGLGLTQRAQYPLIKEYSLNHNMKPYII